MPSFIARRRHVRPISVLGVFAAVAAISCSRVQSLPVMTAAVPVAAPSVDTPTNNAVHEIVDSAVIVQQALPALANSALETTRMIDIPRVVEADVTASVIPAPMGPSWDID